MMKRCKWIDTNNFLYFETAANSLFELNEWTTSERNELVTHVVNLILESTLDISGDDTAKVFEMQGVFHTWTTRLFATYELYDKYHQSYDLTNRWHRLLNSQLRTALKCGDEAVYTLMCTHFEFWSLGRLWSRTRYKMTDIQQALEEILDFLHKYPEFFNLSYSVGAL